MLTVHISILGRCGHSHVRVVTIHDVIISSMILCVGASLVTGVYGYYITLIWTAVAIAYFEVSDTIHPTVNVAVS